MIKQVRQVIDNECFLISYTKRREPPYWPDRYEPDEKAVVTEERAVVIAPNVFIARRTFEDSEKPRYIKETIINIEKVELRAVVNIERNTQLHSQL